MSNYFFRTILGSIALLLICTFACRGIELPQMLHYKRGFFGLNAHTIYRITTDPFGYLWLATNEGILLFDSKTFRPFSTPASDIEFVSAVRVDHFWYCFTFAGEIVEIDLIQRVARIIPYSGKESKSIQPKLNAFKINNRLFFTDNGINIYETISDRSGKIISFQDLTNPTLTFSDLFKHTRIDHPELLDLPLSRIYQRSQSLHRISNHDIILKNALFISSDSLNAGGPKKLLKVLDFGTRENHPYLVDYAINSGALIAGFFNGGGIKFYNFDNSLLMVEDGISLLEGVHVTDIEKSKEGQIWIATKSNGLFLLDFSFVSDAYLNEKIENPEEVTSIKFINDKVFVGTSMGQVQIISPKGIRKFQLPTPNIFNEVYGIYQVMDSLFLFVAKDAMALSDGKRIIWAEAALSKRFAKDSSEDEEHIYIARRREIAVVDKKTLSIKNIAHDSMAYATTVAATAVGGLVTGGPQGLFLNNTSLLPNQDIRVYNLRKWRNYIVACTNRGLLYLDVNGKIIEKWSAHAYMGPLVKKAFVDPNENLYLLSSKGIFYSKNPGAYEPIMYFHESNPIHSIYDITFKENETFIMTNVGLFKINTHSLPEPQQFARIVMKDQYQSSPLDNKATELYSRYATHIFNFENIAFGIPEGKVRWEISPVNTYKVNQIDTTTFQNPFIPYQLDPGDYIITARYLSGNNEPGSTASYFLNITPKFWQRTSVQIVIIILLSILLLIIIRNIIRLRFKLLENRTKRENELTIHRQALQISRMRPHFLFNSFNPIQALILEKRPMEALEYISVLAKLMRNFMNQFEKEFVSVKNELNFLQNYLYIEEKRNEGAYQLIVKIAPEINADQTYIPSMILQPLVENSIIHGRKEGQIVEINIEFKCDDRILYVDIDDNGPGLPEGFELKKSHALEIISRRIALLKKLYKIGSIELSNKEGAHIHLQLPLLKHLPESN